MFTGTSASSTDTHLEAGKFSHFVTEESVYTLVTRMVNEYSRTITKEYKVIVRVLVITGSCTGFHQIFMTSLPLYIFV
jgi:hypothetical protein